MLVKDNYSLDYKCITDTDLIYLPPKKLMVIVGNHNK
jgi:hypothetical protein